MKPFEVHYDQDGFETQTERYQKIDCFNKDSFLMNEPDSLQVIQSLHSAGARRDALTPEYSDALDEEVVTAAETIGRRALVGNVSPLNASGPRELTFEGRINDATINAWAFLSANDIDPGMVRVLRPDRDYTTPLGVVNLDDATYQADGTGLLRPDQAGDFLYTYHHETVLAARPADCPIVFVTAETPKGEVTALLHLAWLGVANGYVDQAKDALDELGVDWETVRAQITPGGHAASFQFEDCDINPRATYPGYESMFVDLTEKTSGDGETVYDFSIDLAAEVYERLVDRWGVDNYQVFLDTSDTTSPTVGYSSHSRSFRDYAQSGENSRDLVLARHQTPPYGAE